MPAGRGIQEKAPLHVGDAQQRLPFFSASLASGFSQLLGGQEVLLAGVPLEERNIMGVDCLERRRRRLPFVQLVDQVALWAS